MTPTSAARRVLVLVEQAYEDLELWYPKISLEEEGMRVVVAGPERICYTGKHGYPCTPDRTLDQVRAEDFDALVIPGGWAPDRLRRLPAVLELVRAFDQAPKPIAMICHAGRVPVSARIGDPRRPRERRGAVRGSERGRRWAPDLEPHPRPTCRTSAGRSSARSRRGCRRKATSSGSMPGCAAVGM